MTSHLRVHGIEGTHADELSESGGWLLLQRLALSAASLPGRSPLPLPFDRTARGGAP